MMHEVMAIIEEGLDFPISNNKYVDIVFDKV
jgi:hypothetical protein